MCCLILVLSALESQLIIAKARVIQLQSDLEDVQLSLERERLLRLQGEQALKLEAEQHATKVSFLERQRRYVSEREEKATKELQETQAEFEHGMASLRAHIKQLEEERYALRRDVSQGAHTLRGASAAQQRELTALRQQAELHEHELQQAQAEVARFRRLHAELASKAGEADALRQTLAQRERSIHDLKTQAQHLQHEMAQTISQGSVREGSASDERRYRQTQRENEYLRQVIENNTLLEEKLMSSEEQVKRLQTQLEASVRKELDDEEARALKQEWDVLQRLPGW